MADKEVKEVAKKQAAPKEKANKKPSIFSRFVSWLKSCKAEMKKVVWASGSAVRNNTLMVLVCIIVVSAVIGLVDYLFSQGFAILGKLI